MKNNIPFAALVMAFTVAGACVGRSVMSDSSMAAVTGIMCLIGGVAAAFCGFKADQ
jgi:hypothetical protein